MLDLSGLDLPPVGTTDPATPTCPGDQASLEQPSTSVSLLDDELMSLGEEGAGPRAGQALLQVGGDAPSTRGGFQSAVTSACSSSCESSGGWGIGTRPISQLRKLRLREMKELVPGPTVKG